MFWYLHLHSSLSIFSLCRILLIIYSLIILFRFRQEVRAERLGSSTSPVQRAFNIASSSCVMVVFLIIGIVSATIASLPLLLLLKISSSVFSYYHGSSHHDIIDSSIFPYSPPSNGSSSNGNSIIDHSLLLGALGPQLSCTKWKILSNYDKVLCTYHWPWTYHVYVLMSPLIVCIDTSSGWIETDSL